MDTRYPRVIEGGLGDIDSAAAKTVEAESPEPAAKLSAKERKLWDYVTQAMVDYGLIHRTDGMLLTIICKTFCDWVAQEEFLQKLVRENGSYYVKTPNGYEQPHQAYYVARDKKRELLKWLPEAALTIPSFHKLKAEQLQPQGDLFDDPIEQFRARKAKLGMRVIPGGVIDDGET
ncbi:P27 family phage terminase small subunit [Azotobacter chroococcum]|uniref:P27 family phage terminase small subunit n=1 Tax=Azotobacter chroococcum TaxID=353 RepID=A0AA44C7A8_9GAMM|nr:P27 family phage terminase small subunit [Azotobacter chroococcum]NHN78576.1 P27 family phage terminase small subunit [Azotobacter chroococcum]